MTFMRSTAVVLLLLVVAAGCRNIATMAVYLIRGTEVEAEYAGLKEQRSVVVCRPVATMAFRDAGISTELTHRLSGMLSERVKKSDVVDAGEVTAWLDERYDSDYTFPEVGNAFDADRVLGIELMEFSLFKGQTLYQGRAALRMVVYERIVPDDEDEDAKGDEKTEPENDEPARYRIAMERDLPTIVWPPNIGVPTSERAKADFRRQFIGVVADHIGRHFYSHDPYTDYAQDAAAMQ
jgi:hypothetical protein